VGGLKAERGREATANLSVWSASAARNLRGSVGEQSVDEVTIDPQRYPELPNFFQQFGNREGIFLCRPVVAKFGVVSCFHTFTC